MRKVIDIFFILLLLAWFVVPSICGAEAAASPQEKLYTVTETELNQLDEKYKIAENSMLNAQNELSEAKKQLVVLNQQLTEARTISAMESERLEKAEQFLKKSAKEMKRVRIQRSVAWSIVGIFVEELIRKEIKRHD